MVGDSTAYTRPLMVEQACSRGGSPHGTHGLSLLGRASRETLGAATPPGQRRRTPCAPPRVAPIRTRLPCRQPLSVRPSDTRTHRLHAARGALTSYHRRSTMVRLALRRASPARLAWVACQHAPSRARARAAPHPSWHQPTRQAACRRRASGAAAATARMRARTLTPNPRRSPSSATRTRPRPATMGVPPAHALPPPRLPWRPAALQRLPHAALSTSHLPAGSRARCTAACTRCSWPPQLALTLPPATHNQHPSRRGANRFMAGSDSSDSEDGKQRVVRSAKDKRFEELSKACDELRVRPRAQQPGRRACLLEGHRDCRNRPEALTSHLCRTWTSLLPRSHGLAHLVFFTAVVLFSSQRAAGSCPH